ncbi:MAG: Dna2/Cas4 domain-containing protein, partial [Tissierellia bacterium]|nr:Dna2/Cas4 domain-containing protein [Tissierellia bacterium]
MLFRSTTRTYIYEDALKNHNIPFFNSSNKRYFYRQEILDIINALKVISNPYDNIATIGFLRSPMVGISDNSLYYILKNTNENKSVFHSMYKLEDLAIKKEDTSKIEEALQLLNYFHEIKETSTISELTADLIERTYFIEIALLKINGRQSLANIYKFIEMVELYEQNNKNSLEDFIDYIEEIKVRDEPEAPMESETSNVVKLLTIHKSKGLEFAVVIIPEMARDTGGRFPNLLFNKDIGLGLKTISCSGFHDEIKDILRVKENEEKERVLYVAMTRAEKMLILGNQGKNRGFKKLTDEHLNKNKYKIISHINLEQESTNKIKIIEDHLLRDSENHNIKKLPLLFHENLNKKFDSYSISQYLVFKQCKRKYYIDFYQGRTEAFGDKDKWEELEINPGVITALDKGNIVHEFAQLYNPGKNVSDLLNSIILSFGLSNEEENLRILRPYIDNYLKLYRDDYDTVFLERPFHIKIGDNYLNGVIDRINIKDNIIEIQDFKTNKVIDKDKLIKQYTPQLQVYAYAVEKIMNIKVKTASIVFLETGQAINVPLEKEHLLANIDSIGKFIHFVENHNDIIDYSKSTNCNYCNYKTICF